MTAEVMSNRLDQRYLNCRIARDFVQRHGRPPRNACIQWERVFNALHRTHALSAIQEVDALLTEYPTELGLNQEIERLRKALAEQQTVFAEVIDMRALP